MFIYNIYQRGLLKSLNNQTKHKNQILTFKVNRNIGSNI